MAANPDLRTLTDRDLEGLTIYPAGTVDLRRDLHVFVGYAAENLITRTVRENQIPKAHARKLAKQLSYPGEVDAVEDQGHGVWSEFVSDVALALGLVKFDTKGKYRGYSSTTESFPENDIEIEEKHWKAYLSKTPLQKEKALLDHLVLSTPSEFFHGATLIDGEGFDRFGSATGPASRMKLSAIRSRLLAMLATLAPDVWYDTRDFVERVRREAPALILDPATRQADDDTSAKLHRWEWDRQYKGDRKTPRPEIVLEDIDCNFREHDPKDRYSVKGMTQIKSSMPDAFRRVEGRYIEWFLREVPFLAGLVSLAYRAPKDPHGLDVVPPLEQLRAFRITRKLSQLIQRSPELDRVKVTVLPTFEVIVEAPSYPENILDALDPYATRVAEDAPVHRLRIDKKRVIETAAARPDARPAVEVLTSLTGTPLPANVVAELSAWAGRGDKVVFYDGLALVEVRGDASRRRDVLECLRDRIVDDRIEGFAVVREPDRTFACLEEKGQVPIRVRHPEARIDGRHGGALAPHPASSASEYEQEQGRGRVSGRAANRKEAAGSRRTVKLEAEDLVGYRCSDVELLAELIEALRGKAMTCATAGGGQLLVLPAAELPRLRATLTRLADRFDVRL